MVLCGQQRGDCEAREGRLESATAGGPIFLPQRKPSKFAQGLLDELTRENGRLAVPVEI